MKTAPQRYSLKKFEKNNPRVIADIDIVAVRTSTDVNRALGERQTGLESVRIDGVGDVANQNEKWQSIVSGG